jgi:Lrp/AsnC family leucine-responsive transcriptional regulator
VEVEYDMDNIDKKILSILSKNGKINNVELAKRIKLTPPATMQRVRRLHKNGVILGYKAILDKKKLGKSLCCIIAIKLTNEEESFAPELIKKYLRGFKGIEEIHLLTGRYDCLIKLYVGDVDELREIMLNKLSKIKIFGHVETFISLSTYENPNFSLID